MNHSELEFLGQTVWVNSLMFKKKSKYSCMHGNLSSFNSFKLPDQPTMTFSNRESLSKRCKVKHLGSFGWGDVALLGDAEE